MTKKKNKSRKPDAPRRRITQEPSPAPPWSTTSLLSAAVLLLAGLLWAYWTTLGAMATKWANDPQYSHGYLVPAFAAALLWMRREQLQAAKLIPNWWGLPLLLSGVALRLAGTYYYFEWFDFMSLLPCLGGIVLLLGGWHAVQWSWPAIGFLFFMIPLPYTVEVALRGPLRHIGTVVSTYLMQTIGLPAWSEGTVVVIDEMRIGVVEACSGLRMLMIFFALSTAVALLCERPRWERAVVVLSAVPIALISNITRITVTGILYVVLADKVILGMQGAEIADMVFHDLAGWLMMPLALGLLWLELWFLSHLIIVQENLPITVGLQHPIDLSAKPAAEEAEATLS